MKVQKRLRKRPPAVFKIKNDFNGGIVMLLSNVFSDMFDDMFDMPTASQSAKGLMNCDVKEYDDH